MNKAITDGIVFMPTPFSAGLSAWSQGDGVPNDPTWDINPNALLIAADADFGNCLEIYKTATLEKLRFTGQTPILPGCYIRVSTRVKCVNGNRPDVRIASYAADTFGNPINGIDLVGSSTYLQNYGEVYEISAIIGVGSRQGVDLVWGTQPAYGHFGIDLLGNVNGAVRIEDIQIEDVTEVFHRKLMTWVDVRDYGAIGDGVANDAAAFTAADLAAEGRELYVPEGDYFIGSNITLDAPVRFTGRLDPASTGRVSLTNNYNYATYMDAFKDEQVALEKALEALYNFTDHDSLDLMGRRISLTRPIDVQAVVRNKTTFGNRRVIRNGHLAAEVSSDWDEDVVIANATYSISNDTKLTNVANIAAISAGSVVTGQGVGREVYVREVDISNNTLTLSQPLYGGNGTQSYTFTRFKYMLDFSGFSGISRQVLSEVEFLCTNRASCVMLGRDGIAWHIHDCWFVRPKDRGITSIGDGCNGLSLRNCEFISSENNVLAQDRTTIAVNTNKNDMKIRNNRVVQFRHFAVMAGGGHMILGNHWWQGDSAANNGQRTAGIVLAGNNIKTTLTGNYCDNSFIEISSEYNPTQPGNALGNVSIVGNIFTASSISTWFTYIRLAPYWPNQEIDGVSVMGNSFKTIGGDVIDRVDSIDTSSGSINFTTVRDVYFSGNTYKSVTLRTQSPLVIEVESTSNTNNWVGGTADLLPFGGYALGVDAIVMDGPVRNSSNTVIGDMPYALTQQGASQSDIRLVWPQSVRGKVRATVRVDQLS